MNYAQIAVSAVEILLQATPVIIEDIRAILAPIKEGRLPTEDEWKAAENSMSKENISVQQG